MVKFHIYPRSNGQVSPITPSFRPPKFHVSMKFGRCMKIEILILMDVHLKLYASKPITMAESLKQTILACFVICYFSEMLFVLLNFSSLFDCRLQCLHLSWWEYLKGSVIPLDVKEEINF
jgi:hypothetical protein